MGAVRKSTLLWPTEAGAEDLQACRHTEALWVAGTYGSPVDSRHTEALWVTGMKSYEWKDSLAGGALRGRVNPQLGLYGHQNYRSISP